MHAPINAHMMCMGLAAWGFPLSNFEFLGLNGPGGVDIEGSGLELLASPSPEFAAIRDADWLRATLLRLLHLL